MARVGGGDTFVDWKQPRPEYAVTVAQKEEAEAAIAAADHVATLVGTLHSYSLQPSGAGYMVKFFVGMEQANEVVSLNDALQRIVTIDIRKYRRVKSEALEQKMKRLSYQGTDDDDE